MALPNGYRIGDDEATVVNLDIEIDNKVGPIWDVIGTIEGSEEPDELVLLGNHRDAWVCGAIDPNSGSSVLLEIARGYGELLKRGWKPRRTLILALGTEKSTGCWVALNTPRRTPNSSRSRLWHTSTWTP